MRSSRRTWLEAAALVLAAFIIGFAIAYYAPT
jgi:hypothetical protein